MLSVDMQYYNMNGKLPHITYEFTIPSHDITAVKHITIGPTHSHLNLTYNTLNEDAGGDQLKATNHSRPSIQFRTRLGNHGQSDAQLQEEEEEEEGLVWEIQTPSPPPAAVMLLYRPADVTSHVISHNNVEERGPPAPSGYSESQTELLFNFMSSLSRAA